MKRLFILALTFTLTLSIQAQTMRFFEFDFHTPYPDSLNLFAATANGTVQADCDAELLLPDTMRFKHINGLIDHGTADNNPIYIWHFVPNNWDLADISIELCDGLPLEDVQADTAYWIGTVKRFCPWNSYLKREVPVNANPDPSNSARISIGPNPVDDQLFVRNNGDGLLRMHSLLDAQGRTLRTFAGTLAPGAETQVDMREMAGGVHYLVLWWQGGFVVERVLR